MTLPETVPTPAYRNERGLWVFSRQDFASRYFNYDAGEHVAFGGPTQNGKTTLCFDLLEYCATVSLPAYVAVSKPKDPTTQRATERLGFRRVEDWPVPIKVSELWNGKPPGYVVWPKFGDLNTDVERAASVTRRLIEDRYSAGVKNKPGILVLDDTMIKSKILGLDSEMVKVLAMAGAMDLGLWVMVQKPTDSGRTAIWSWSQSEHIFIAVDPDKRSRERYDQIGGVDPKIVETAVATLEPYQFLYIKRTGRHMCIVDKA